MTTSGAGEVAASPPSDPGPASKRGNSYRWWALGVTTFTQASSVAITSALGPLAPLLQADFNIDRAQIGLISAAVYLSANGSAMFGGRGADRVGERRVLLISAAIATAATLVAAGMVTFWGFLLAAFVIGIGTGIQNPAGSAAIIRWFPHRRRGFAMGIRQTGVPIGGVLAATLWPLVALSFGWRSAYVAAALVTLIGGALVYFYYHDPERQSGPGVAGPRALRDLMSDRRLWLLAITYGGQVLAQFSANVFFVLFLTQWLGVPLLLASLLLALVNVMAIAGRIGWGAISDAQFGGRRRPVLLIVSCLTLATLLLAAALPRGAPPAIAVVLAILLGVSAFSWTGILGTLVIELAGQSSAATAVAWVHVLGGAGSLLGPPLFGLIVDQTGSYSLAWLFAAAVVTLGLIATFRVREPRAGEAGG